MANFPTKNLHYASLNIDEDLWNREIEEFKERRESANARLAKGFLDAPEYWAAVPLTAGYAYMINVPGYFMPSNTSAGTGMSVFVGPSPSSLARYSLGYSGYNKSIPLLPGKSTYAAVDSSAFFVPAAIGTCLNLNPDEYVVKISYAGGLSSKGYNVTTIANAQEGDWYNPKRMRSMLGRWVIDERITGNIDSSIKYSFQNTYRVKWLKDHNVPISYYYPKGLDETLPAISRQT